LTHKMTVRTTDVYHNLPATLLEQIHPDLNLLVDNTALKYEQSNAASFLGGATTTINRLSTIHDCLQESTIIVVDRQNIGQRGGGGGDDSFQLLTSNRWWAKTKDEN
jgi:hypothetical protein